SISSIDTSNELFLIQFNHSINTNKSKNILSLYSQNIFDNSPNGIAILSTDKTILTANKSFYSIFEYSEDEMIGKNINDLVVPKEKRYEIKNLFENKIHNKKIILSTQRITKRKKMIDVKITRHSITTDNNIVGYYIIYQDISEENKIKRNLTEIKDFSNQLFDNSIYPIAFLDTNETVLNINSEFTKIFKFSKKESLGKNITELIIPNKYLEESNTFKKSMLKKVPLKKITKRKDKFNILIDVEAIEIPVILNNKLVGMFAMYRDMREEVNALNELERQQAYFKELFYKSSDAIALLSTDNKIININTKFEKFFKYNITELLDKNIDDYIVSNTHSDTARNYTNHIVNKKSPICVDAIRTNKFGEDLDVEITAYPINLHDNTLGIFAIYRDISDRKEKENEIKKLIFTDNLTGIYNRRKFHHTIEAEIKRHDRYNIPLSLVMFDIDKFKNINDTFGHLVGDKILIEVSSLVYNNIRENDYFFRWGGDEFIILLPHTTLAHAEIFTKKMEQIIENSTFTKNISLSISSGVALYKTDLDSLLITADTQMYKIKNQKKNSS
ncbi:MAG: PAS domain S-box protein, partial [Bacillota bacterium]|nr:PAS domain S-box protein [Bacillota bacterium]